ncbi:MAG: TIGR00266 family protein [Desulfobacteraceae bacterium]|nr:TIGR00266 family protein [Desulfobacteraceae bacterium]
MSQWYLSFEGKQVGPFDRSQAIAHARQNSAGFAWRDGFTDWMPISQIEELNSSSAGSKAPPPMTGRTTSDEIDFKIMGAEMQFVEVELDPGESVVAEAGAMMYKDMSVQMETVFGDASGSDTGGRFMDKLIGAGKRLLTGESLFMTVFTHTGQGKAHVAFGAPYPGNIIPVPLPSVGGSLICQKDSFLCAAKGVAVGIHFQKKILTGLFGGEGFIMQRLDGDGMVFIHAGGTIVNRTLSDGETLHVDTGCVVAIAPTVQFDIQQAGNIKSALFGGEGLFFATIKGPGQIWLQSLPFSRLAGRMLQASPERGGGKGEGSILGSLGDLIDGD